MEVDTGEFRALTGQVASLGRRITYLSGRVSIMGTQLGQVGVKTGEDLSAIVTLLEVFFGDGPRKPVPRRVAARSRSRHLRAVK